MLYKMRIRPKGIMTNRFEMFLHDNGDDVEEYLERYFQDASHPDMNTYLYGPLAEYSANAGKRHRPIICMLGSAAVGGEFGAARSAAVAIEHFHTAALIHDDIADGSLLRRGKPCMHLVEGEGLAINSGDLALSLVTGTVVKDDTLPDPIKLRVLSELVDMTTRTIEGQALDLGWARDKRFDLTVDDYLVMAQHKTAFYSGGVPLAVGAIIGGGTDEQIEALREFGLMTGLAFQIQDDILNLVGDAEATKKDFRSDITEGKRTLVVVHALENSADAEELRDILASGTTDPDLMARAVEILEESGSIEFARQHSLDLSADARALLDPIEIEPEAKELLISMSEFFVHRLV